MAIIKPEKRHHKLGPCRRDSDHVGVKSVLYQ